MNSLSSWSLVLPSVISVSKMHRQDFPGGPVVKTALLVQGACIQSLVGKLALTCLSEDRRSHVLQLRLGTAKQINIKKRERDKAASGCTESTALGLAHSRSS